MRAHTQTKEFILKIDVNICGKLFTVWVLHKEGFMKKEKRVGETAQQVEGVAVKLEFYHQSPHGGGRKLSPDFHRQTDRHTMHTKPQH